MSKINFAAILENCGCRNNCVVEFIFANTQKRRVPHLIVLVRHEISDLPIVDTYLGHPVQYLVIKIVRDRVRFCKVFDKV